MGNNEPHRRRAERGTSKRGTSNVQRPSLSRRATNIEIREKPIEPGIGTVNWNENENEEQSEEEQEEEED
jgi:hypothetical protein